MFGRTKEKFKEYKKKWKNKHLFLVVSACVLLIALTISAVLILGNGENVIDYGTVMNGVTVNGIDISGMTVEEAKNATADISEDMLSKVQFTLDVEGAIYIYTADDFNISTDYQDVIARAVSYGHSDTSDAGKENADPVGESGSFDVSLSIDELALKAALTKLKQTIDTLPQDATVAFMPWGYTEDGTAYEPDPKALADAHSVGDDLERPELVRREETDKQNELRYQFWNEDEYEEGYTFVDADILRFQYTEEEDGLVIDAEFVAEKIQNALKTGDFSTIVVPVEVAEAEVSVEDLKEDTQLIVSWTSSYRGHSNKDRNWNVSRMSSFVNGVEILPGGEWSVNDTAGPRNATTAREIGWKKAAGLYQGATTQQYGGGVCQLGSTTYNAALRADLTIVEFWHHSDPSGYIPKGLDATLDSGGKDLVLRNDGTTPVYLVSYIDPEEETVTVEVYGRLPYNEKYKQHVIYDYTSDNKGTRYGSGGVHIIEATQTPKGNVLSPERPTIVFSSPRRGYKVEVFKHIYALDGTKLENTLFRISNYKPINGYTYVYPAHLMPGEPTPEPGEPTPQPGEPTPQPGEPTPQPGEPTPEPGEPTPEPGEPTPQPGEPTPEPGEPTPEPGEPTPEPGEPTPEPGEPTPEPGDPTPEPGDPTPEP